MKIQERKGKKPYVIDMGWIDDNGNIISLKEMMDKNQELLFEGLDPRNAEDANFMLEFWYSIGTTMVNERKFASTWVQWLRKLPDILHELLGNTVSRSSMRVKRDTLYDYPYAEQKIIIHKLAHFQMIKASRDRQLAGGSGDEKCNKDFYPIYEIAGYETVEEFEKDFLNREKEFLQDKIKTNHEVGVALGIIIMAHIRDKTFINSELRGNVNSKLIEAWVFTKEKNAKNFEMQNNLIHYIAGRINTVANDYFIDTKELKFQPYDRSAILYPT